MTIGKPTTQEEFEALGPSHRSRRAESLAVKALLPLTGVKFPCRWKHHMRNVCAGAALVRYAASAAGFKINTRCREKVLYVFRYE